MITLFDHGMHLPVLWTHVIPATLEGRAVHNVQNAMFATAIAFSMGATIEEIRRGLETFDMSFDQAPGRMNVYDGLPFRVIMDYGHNPAAVRAMCELVDRLEVKGRRLCVLAAPGDRRDEDIAEIGREAAGHFAHYFVRRDDALRGRKPDEVPAMLRAALLEAGVPVQDIDVIPDEQRAVDTALAAARPGDLLLMFSDALARTWRQVTEFHPAAVPQARTNGSAAKAEPAVETLDELDEQLLVRDERGVRLARETEVTD
jgi:cyanophycin synthetase